MPQIATVQSTKPITPPLNPRVELRKIVEANIKKDKTTHFRLFSDLAFEGLDKSDLSGTASDLLNSVIGDWFGLNYDLVLRAAEANELAKMQASPSKRDQQRAAKLLAEKEAKLVAKREAKKAAQAAAVSSTSATMSAAVEAIKNKVLMDVVLPFTGKKLRDSTGDECAAAGGWYSRIALDMSTRGVSGGLVGAILTEKRLQQIAAGK